MSDIGERIIAGAARPREEVTDKVPEWREFIGEAKLYIASMSVEDHGIYEADIAEKREVGTRALIEGYEEALVARCLVDENYERVFSEEQIARLKKLDHDPFFRLLEVAYRVNKMRRKDAEDLEKNSGGAPASGSSTG